MKILINNFELDYFSGLEGIFITIKFNTNYVEKYFRVVRKIVRKSKTPRQHGKDGRILRWVFHLLVELTLPGSNVTAIWRSARLQTEKTATRH
jgi:hypothetical protein